MTGKLSTRDRGVNLAELMVAGALLSLLVIFLLNLFPAALAALSASKAAHTANLLAQSAIEIHAAVPFSDLTLGVQDVGTVEVPPGYELEVQVTAVDDYSVDHLKRIGAVVRYRRWGVSKEVKQELYVHSAH